MKIYKIVCCYKLFVYQSSVKMHEMATFVVVIRVSIIQKNVDRSLQHAIITIFDHTYT